MGDNVGRDDGASISWLVRPCPGLVRSLRRSPAAVSPRAPWCICRHAELNGVVPIEQVLPQVACLHLTIRPLAKRVVRLK